MHSPGIRVKALFFLPALLPKPKVGSPSRILFCLFESHLGQDGVEIFSSQMFNPGRGHDPMAEVGHLDHGEVERTAAEVIRITSYNVCYTKLLRAARLTIGPARFKNPCSICKDGLFDGSKSKTGG